jgi:hypothetical protein
MSYREALIHWSQTEYACFGLKTQLTQHQYHQLPLFTQAALIDLLENYPRQQLQAFTMGTDPSRRSDWKSVDIPDHANGKDIWHAVEKGRLWLNIIKIETYSQDYADLIQGMYEHLDQHCPHLSGPQADYSTLLISSPGAQVYYHLDAAPNMLWHLRGQKRAWIYPAMDLQFVPQDFLEDIYAGEIDEEIPYDPTYDQYADCFVLKPGDVVSWPHNAPHRIENLDMNVSLATSYRTPMVARRALIQRANRFILRPLGIKKRSMAETGMGASLKCLTYKVINKVRPFQMGNPTVTYVTDLQLDPEAPEGIRQLNQKKPASFAILH